MEDLLLIGIAITFFILCFGLIRFFDALTRSDE